MVKNESDIEKQLGIKTENLSIIRSNTSQAAASSSATVDSARPSVTWVQERKDLIDKIVSLKTENQILTKNMNEKCNELSILNKTKETLEARLKEQGKEHVLVVGGLQTVLSKSNEKAESNQKRIAELKRDNQLLNGQMKQLQSTLVKDEDAGPNDVDVYEVENLLDDKMVTNTERHYLVRWKGFDFSQDSWERESNLHCPDILKKYKKNKTKQ